jgi:hypothetical protein
VFFLIEIKDIVRSHKYVEKGEELIAKMPALASEENNYMYELLFSKLIDDSGKDSVVVKDMREHALKKWSKR